MTWPPPLAPWPESAEELVAVQEGLASLTAPPWPLTAEIGAVAACFACFRRGRRGLGAAGDEGWAAACLLGMGAQPVTVVAPGRAATRYEPGLLALREGPLLETALRALPVAPDLLVVNATGRDHPRRAGLALHLGARLGMPSIGVTGRPLLASGPLPLDRRGATAPLWIAGEIVAYWVRTRAGVRPLVAHPGWRTDTGQAIELLTRLTRRWRSPEPLRIARQAARSARAADAQAPGRAHPPADARG